MIPAETVKSETGVAGLALDLVAFAIGLGVAWYLRWDTGDLVWSLWLSSLVVGYAMIVNNIFGPIVRLGLAARKEGGGAGGGAVILAGAIGGLALLAFFSFHFGMFHLVHSVFLNAFFPLANSDSFPSLAGYEEVFRRYWYFLPAAVLAERQAFRPRPVSAASGASMVATLGKNDGMMQPYKNVLRMHLLIFFFIGAHILKLENFVTYAVVYAVYFFPWRIVGAHWKRAAQTPPAN